MQIEEISKAEAANRGYRYAILDGGTVLAGGSALGELVELAQDLVDAEGYEELVVGVWENGLHGWDYYAEEII